MNGLSTGDFLSSCRTAVSMLSQNYELSLVLYSSQVCTVLTSGESLLESLIRYTTRSRQLTGTLGAREISEYAPWLLIVHVEDNSVARDRHNTSRA